MSDEEQAKPVAPAGRELCSGRCWLQPGERNHPTGMIFVGWGHGWQPCSRCGGEGLEPLHGSLARPHGGGT